MCKAKEFLSIYQNVLKLSLQRKDPDWNCNEIKHLKIKYDEVVLINRKGLIRTETRIQILKLTRLVLLTWHGTIIEIPFPVKMDLNFQIIFIVLALLELDIELNFISGYKCTTYQLIRLGIHYKCKFQVEIDSSTRQKVLNIKYVFDFKCLNYKLFWIIVLDHSLNDCTRQSYWETDMELFNNPSTN